MYYNTVLMPHILIHVKSCVLAIKYIVFHSLFYTQVLYVHYNLYIHVYNLTYLQ